MAEEVRGLQSKLVWELLVRATRFEFGSGVIALDKRGSEFKDDSWAIVHQDGTIWSRKGEWVREPLPSARTAAFKAETRWTLKEACYEVAQFLGEESTFKAALLGTGAPA
jgi:hypothetical protein